MYTDMIYDGIDGPILVDRYGQPAGAGMRQRHYHDHYELYYLLSGRRKYFINHTVYPVEEGDIVLVQKGDVHITQAAGNSSYVRYLVNFDERALEGLGSSTASLLACYASKLIHVPPGRREHLEHLLSSMELEYHEYDVYSAHMLRCRLVELLVFVNRCAQNQSAPVPQAQDGPAPKIQEAARFICEHYMEPLSLAAAARVAGMSPSYFSRQFKAVTGMCFSQFVNNVRVKEASRLLLSSKACITDVAFACGFEDSNYFGDVFRRLRGLSPSQYRKQHGIF